MVVAEQKKEEICFVLSGKNFFPTTPSFPSYLMYDAAE